MTTNDLSYRNAIQALTELITTNDSNLDDLKLKLYLDWITTKTEFLQKEGQPYDRRSGNFRLPHVRQNCPQNGAGGRSSKLHFDAIHRCQRVRTDRLCHRRKFDPQHGSALGVIIREPFQMS